MAKTKIDLDGIIISYSQTPSLFSPSIRCATVLRSFTTNEEGKNLIEILLEKYNLEINIRFLFILRTQSKKKLRKSEGL